MSSTASPYFISNTTDTAIRLDDARRQRIKWAYTTRLVPERAACQTAPADAQIEAGDLVLARIDALGQHKFLELRDGRKAALFNGDEIAVCFGNRYAPDQFEAFVPKRLEACHLVAGGGIAAVAKSWHDGMRAPTAITPLGLLSDQHGKTLNLRDWGLRETNCSVADRPFTIVVIGTAMNAGKTTSAAALVKSAANAGLKVGAAKITGTGSGGDKWLMKDAGGQPVLDFTDAGVASTYLLDHADVLRVSNRLLGHLYEARCEAIVLEIADGLYQQETARLLADREFTSSIDAVLFAANDAAGAVSGMRWLDAYGLPLAAITGALTRSPLAMRETALATGLPVVPLAQLREASFFFDLRARFVVQDSIAA